MAGKRKEMNLKDLIVETEQKILDNEYFEDVDIEYKDIIVHARIRPISQKKFSQISRNKSALDNAEFHTLIVQEGVLNMEDNTPFTRKQIEEFFTAGLVTLLSLKCMEISGISLTEEQFKKLKNY